MERELLHTTTKEITLAKLLEEEKKPYTYLWITCHRVLNKNKLNNRTDQIEKNNISFKHDYSPAVCIRTPLPPSPQFRTVFKINSNTWGLKQKRAYTEQFGTQQKHRCWQTRKFTHRQHAVVEIILSIHILISQTRTWVRNIHTYTHTHVRTYVRRQIKTGPHKNTKKNVTDLPHPHPHPHHHQGHLRYLTSLGFPFWPETGTRRERRERDEWRQMLRTPTIVCKWPVEIAATKSDANLGWWTDHYPAPVRQINDKSLPTNK